MTVRNYKKNVLGLGIIQVAFGLLFAFTIATDIQFGFAVILLTVGLHNIFYYFKNEES